MTKELNVTMIALFAALIAVLGLIPPISLPIGVPITAQSLGVMLAGTILGSKRGFLAVLLFVVLASIGLPILSGGRGGLGVFAGPTVGFVLGFPFAAFVTGWICEKMKDTNIFTASFLGAVIGSILVLYVLGIIGMMFNLGLSFGAGLGAMFIYIPGDIIKAVIAALITGYLFRSRPEYVYTR